MPRVSIIIPSYNHARFLEKRFESIYAQTFTDYEIIFLDDGSDDRSVELYRRLRNEKCVKEILRERNTGNLYRQWNAGLAQASGEYVWIAESDDWSHPGFLNELAGILDNDDKVGMAYCRSNFIDDEDGIINSNREWAGGLDAGFWERSFVMDGGDFVSRYLVLNYVVSNTSSVLFRKSAWDDTGDIPENIRYVGDWLKWAQIARLYDVAYSERRLNNYRHHDVTLRATYRDGYRDFYREMYELFTYMTENFEIGHAVREKRLEALCCEWIGKIIYNSNFTETEKLGNVARLCRELRRFDGSMPGRVMRNMVKEYALKVVHKSSGLLKDSSPAKY